jgi:acetyl esterase/lipase/mannose-6-phosphate isomerase-like protein (cupin superfamily)
MRMRAAVDLLVAVITGLAASACAVPDASRKTPALSVGAKVAPRMVVVDQRDVSVDQPPPHGAIGMSTAYRISDVAPGRTMEFRRRVLHPGSAIGEHPIDHDEVYYVLAGEGEVISDGERRTLSAGMAAYLYDGAVVGIRQLGEAPLDLIISYPLKPVATRFLVDPGRAPDLEIELWPGGAPGGEDVKLTEHVVDRDNPFGLVDRAAHDVTRPTLSVFRPARPDGSAILIIPGGGYRWVVIDKEGFEGARWFSRQGATVYVLKHRLPHQGWAAGPDTPLQDAQRAIRIIRSRAATDGVDPARVMVMGFSAGGHVAGSLATRFAAPVYEPRDTADGLSARPDAAVLMYPVVSMKAEIAHAGSRANLLGDAPQQTLIETYSLEIAPPSTTPPTLLIHAADDSSVPVDNALVMFDALRKAGVATSLHVFDSGGHGFGLRGIEDDPRSAWPGLVMDWGRRTGVFAKP